MPPTALMLVLAAYPSATIHLDGALEVSLKSRILLRLIADGHRVQRSPRGQRPHVTLLRRDDRWHVVFDGTTTSSVSVDRHPFAVRALELVQRISIGLEAHRRPLSVSPRPSVVVPDESAMIPSLRQALVTKLFDAGLSIAGASRTGDILLCLGAVEGTLLVGVARAPNRCTASHELSPADLPRAATALALAAAVPAVEPTDIDPTAWRLTPSALGGVTVRGNDADGAIAGGLRAYRGCWGLGIDARLSFAKRASIDVLEVVTTMGPGAAHDLGLGPRWRFEAGLRGGLLLHRFSIPDSTNGHRRDFIGEVDIEAAYRVTLDGWFGVAASAGWLPRGREHRRGEALIWSSDAWRVTVGARLSFDSEL